MANHPYAPYAAPQPPSPGFYGYRERAPGVFGGDVRGHKPWVAWVFLGCIVLSLLAFAIGLGLAISADDMDDLEAADGAQTLGGLLIFGALMLYNVKLILSLVWLHGAWSWLPMEQRVTGGGKVVSPGNAVGLLFLPYYNLYWMFVANVGLCDAMDRMRLSFRGVRPAPRGAALGACICQVIPIVNLFVAPFFWFFYMRGVDQFREDMHRELAAAPAAAY